MYLKAYQHRKVEREREMTESSTTFVVEMNEITRPFYTCAAKGEDPRLISTTTLYIIDMAKRKMSVANILQF